MRLTALVATVVSWPSAGSAYGSAASPGGQAGLAGAVNDAITRLDGLKMALLRCSRSPPP